MNLSDYEAIWKRQPLPVGEQADIAELRKNFEGKHRKMAAALLVRDWAEIGACGVVVPFYVFYWWQMGTSAWPMGLAIILVLGVAAFFLRERARARRRRLGADASLVTKVEADIVELRHQCNLLRRVWAWYLAPCAGAMTIHMFVIVQHTPAWSPLRQPAVILGFGAFFAALIGFAWVINWRALRKRLEPGLAELEKLHRDLLAPQ